MNNDVINIEGLIKWTCSDALPSGLIFLQLSGSLINLRVNDEPEKVDSNDTIIDS